MKASNSDRPVIVWFRDDLRLSDHPALHEAAMTGAPVICLYVLDEQSAPLHSQGRQIGAASRWWLAQSLKSLQGSLSQFRQKLVLRKGAAATVLSATLDD